VAAYNKDYNINNQNIELKTKNNCEIMKIVKSKRAKEAQYGKE